MPGVEFTAVVFVLLTAPSRVNIFEKSLAGVFFPVQRIGAAHEDDPVVHRQAIAIDVAVDFGLAAQFDPAGGVDVALDFAVNQDVVDLDLGLDQGLLPHGQSAAFGLNGTLKPAVELELAGEGEGAFKFAIGSQDSGGAGPGGLSRTGSYRREWRGAWSCR